VSYDEVANTASAHLPTIPTGFLSTGAKSMSDAGLSESGVLFGTNLGMLRDHELRLCAVDGAIE